MPEVVLQSPLAGITRLGQRVLNADSLACTLSEEPFIEMLNIRGNAKDIRFSQAVREVTGLDIPTRANTVSVDSGRQLLWMGPDEWLLKLKSGGGAEIEMELRQALQGVHFSVVQVGDGSTTLVLRGPGAATLIARGCPLDLHARAFSAGMVAQSHIAKASVTLLCIQTQQSYEVTVRRSFADYLFRWFCEAGQ